MYIYIYICILYVYMINYIYVAITTFWNIASHDDESINKYMIGI